MQDLQKNCRLFTTYAFTNSKVSSEQEACGKCFAVHISKFEKLANRMEKLKQRTSVPYLDFSFSLIVLSF